MTDYRGFSEDLKSYKYKDITWNVKKVSALKLTEWQKQMDELKNDTSLTLFGKEAELAKDILENAFDGFSYDQSIKDDIHPKVLAGMAGEVFTFLYLSPPEEELSLLKARLTPRE